MYVTLKGGWLNGIIQGPVEALDKNSNKYVKATVLKLTDSSQYTVRFHDGDERTLRRAAVTIMGPSHYGEGDTLGGFPLTDPESFGAPVATVRRLVQRTSCPAAPRMHCWS